jgi:CRP/FNR family transcriptional regulator
VTKPELLHSLPLFRTLSEQDRRRLAADIVETQHRQGDFIFREGDPAHCFHIVKSGSVKCVKSSPEGKELTLKVLLPGDLFCCEAAVFDGGIHPGCAQSMGDVSILRLDKKTYFDLLRRNPDAALEVIRYLGQRLNEAQESAKALALAGGEKRLASLLLDLAERAGVAESRGIRITVRLTRQDLANMAGLAVETVIRLMSRFKRARLVSGTARSLTIIDAPGLKALVAGHAEPASGRRPSSRHSLPSPVSPLAAKSRA